MAMLNGTSYMLFSPGGMVLVWDEASTTNYYNNIKLKNSILGYFDRPDKCLLSELSSKTLIDLLSIFRPKNIMEIFLVTSF